MAHSVARFDVLRVAPVLYRLAAISNFVVSIPVFVAYDAYVGALMPAKPNFPFLVWIWTGMAMLWGLMFWEIAGDPVGRRRLIKYSYLEKAVTAASVTVAVVTGSLLPVNLAGIVLTDVIWIPVFIVIHWRVTRRPAPAAAS